MAEDDAKRQAQESAALVVDGIIKPILKLTRGLMLDEFRTLDREQVNRFMDRLEVIVVTGSDPRAVDPNARINFGDVSLTYMRDLIEGKADDKLEREDRGLSTS